MPHHCRRVGYAGLAGAIFEYGRNLGTGDWNTLRSVLAPLHALQTRANGGHGSTGGSGGVPLCGEYGVSFTRAPRHLSHLLCSFSCICASSPPWPGVDARPGEATVAVAAGGKRGTEVIVTLPAGHAAKRAAVEAALDGYLFDYKVVAAQG